MLQDLRTLWEAFLNYEACYLCRALKFKIADWAGGRLEGLENGLFIMSLKFSWYHLRSLHFQETGEKESSVLLAMWVLKLFKTWVLDSLTALLLFLKKVYTETTLFVQSSGLPTKVFDRGVHPVGVLRLFKNNTQKKFVLRFRFFGIMSRLSRHYNNQNSLKPAS